MLVNFKFFCVRHQVVVQVSCDWFKLFVNASGVYLYTVKIKLNNHSGRITLKLL